MKTNRLLLVLGSALFLSTACTANETPEEAAPPSGASANYLSLMPKESTVLIYANLENLRQTSLGAEIHSELENNWRDDEDEEYREFVEATGVDPEKDIYEIWASIVPKEEDDSFGGAVIRGRFDQKRIVDYMKSQHRHEVRERSYLGHTVYILPEDDGDGENEMTFLNSETVLMGNPVWFETALKNHKDEGDNVFDNPAMAQYINDVQHKQQLWCVVNLEDISGKWVDEVRKRGSSFQGTESIENMKSILFCTDIDKRARIFLTGNFGTEEEADLIAEMLTGFKAMAKLMVSDDREAIDIINDIKIKSDGATLRISTNFDKETIEKVQEKRRKFSDKPVKLL